MEPDDPRVGLEQASKQVEDLREQIRLHDYQYYVVAEPTISDLQYDRLLQHLTAWEKRFPSLVTPESPTQKIGDQPVEGLRQVAHRIPMLSIENTYTEAELRDFLQRVEKLLSGQPVE